MSEKVMKETKVAKEYEQNTTVRAKKLAQGFAEIKSEFKKISWTSRDELITYTKIVVMGTFLMGALVFFTDVTIRAVLHWLDAILRAVTGI